MLCQRCIIPYDPMPKPKKKMEPMYPRSTARLQTSSKEAATVESSTNWPTPVRPHNGHFGQAVCPKSGPTTLLFCDAYVSFEGRGSAPCPFFESSTGQLSPSRLLSSNPTLHPLSSSSTQQNKTVFNIH